jgi:L-cysteine S-thiosulfotransferase
MSVRRSRSHRFTAAMFVFAAIVVFAALGAVSPAGEIAPQDLRSGFLDMSPESRTMQSDDTANPGMLTVLEGEALWKQPAGADRRSCADCHGDAAATMRGVAARHPSYSPAQQRPITLEERINLCRTGQQKAAPLTWESPALLGLTAYVAHQSRGLPITAGDDERSRPFVDEGRQLFEERQGQLNLSCAACHTDHRGGRLAGNPIPQGHPTGYPLYRLEWQSTGSLQRRLRNCMTGVRAEPYEYGSPEFANLELYLMWRARGLPLETPAVRP